MPDFTVVMILPASIEAADPIANSSWTSSVESDDVSGAVNAAAARMILEFRRAGCALRPEEIQPLAVFPGRHVNLLFQE